MSFNKFTWVDRVSEYPSRRTITDTSTGVSQTATIVRNEGTVTEQGTPFNATNMNSLEDRIDNMFPVSIANGGTGATTVQNARSNLGIYGQVLFEDVNGTQNTILLSDSSANYTYLEIFYKTNDADISSRKVYSPNGKQVEISATLYNDTGFYLKTAWLLVSGTSVTWVTHGFARLRNNNEVYVTNTNNLYVTRIVGLN